MIKPSNKELSKEIEEEVLAAWEETMRLTREEIERTLVDRRKNTPKKKGKKTPASR